MRVKNGFTLIELITTILIIGVLLLISIPIYNNMTGKSQERVYNNKITMVELAAMNFTEDFKNEIKSAGEPICIPIETLIKEGKLVSDVKDGLYLTNPYQEGVEKQQYLVGQVEVTYENESLEVNYVLGGTCAIVINPSEEMENRYVVDVTPPTGKLTIKEGKYTNQQTVHLKLEVDEDTETFCYKDSSVGKCLIKRKISEVNKNEIEYTFPSTVDELKNVYVWLEDKYGNISEPLHASITYDKTKPTGSFTIDQGLYTNNRNISLTLNQTDNLSGVDRMCINYTGTECTASNWEPYSTTKAMTLPDSDGNHTIYVWYRDRSMNVSSSGYNQTIMLDRQNPETTDTSIIIKNGDAYTNTKNVTLTLSSTDPSPASGVYTMCISQTSICSTWIPYSTSHSITLLDDEGTKTVYVRFKDRAGNISVQRSDTIILDTIKPTVSFDLAEGTYNTPKTVVVTANDLNYKNMSVHVYKDGVKNDSKSRDNMTSTTYSVNLDRHGSWVVYVKAYDLAGNLQSTTPQNSSQWTYASYTLNLKYTLTYNNTGGSGCSTKQITYMEPYGTLCSPTRAGYGFVEWRDSASGGNVINSTTTVTLTTNQTIYARWSICPAGTYSNGSTSSCQACPSGYTSEAGATVCYINVATGKRIATAGSTSSTNCPAGTYHAAHTVNYGQTSTACTNCPTGYTSTAGTAGVNTDCYISVAAGKRIATANSSSTTNCAVGTYKAAHTIYYGQTSTACTNCPSGYTSAAGTAGANTDCYISVAAGKRIATANSTSTTNCTAGTYHAAHTVNYGSTSTACANCPSGYTSAAGTAGSASACYISVAAGKRIATATSSSTVNCTAGTYKAAHTVNYGSTSTACTNCPTGYTSTAGTAGVNTDCYISVAAGKRIATANSSSTTNCAVGTYKAAHTVNYGSTSTACANCPSGYTSAAGTAGSASACYISVAAGKRIATATSSSTVNCTAGTYKAAHTVNYGSTSTACANCPSGYTSTAGAAGANTDCFMNVAGGYYLVKAASSATICPANTYKTAHTVNYNSNSSCINCVSGYTSSPGATSCTLQYTYTSVSTGVFSCTPSGKWGDPTYVTCENATLYKATCDDDPDSGLWVCQCGTCVPSCYSKMKAREGSYQLTQEAAAASCAAVMEQACYNCSNPCYNGPEYMNYWYTTATGYKKTVHTRKP